MTQNSLNKFRIFLSFLVIFSFVAHPLYPVFLVRAQGEASSEVQSESEEQSNLEVEDESSEEDENEKDSDDDKEEVSQEDQSAENTEETENTEDTEDTENMEDTEDTESTENTETYLDSDSLSNDSDEADVSEEVNEETIKEEDEGEKSVSDDLVATENEVVVESDEAVAVANVLNDVNSNVTTENGERMSEVIYEHIGDINLLDHFENILRKAKAENSGSLNVSNNNEATISNEVSALAKTGENEVLSDGRIETGEAFSEAGAVNFVNQNIVGNNWLFAAITVFGDWVGDLIVPGKNVLKVPTFQGYETMNVSNENSAVVENNVSAESQTGENVLGGEGVIVSGNASSQTEILNLVNTNIVKDNWFFLLINNMGLWNGLVLNWDGQDASSGQYAYDFEIDPRGEIFSPSGTLNVSNVNNADVTNNVSAKSETGGNTLAGSGSVETGDAFSYSGVFNFINSNIVGNNWFFGMVNVMGAWTGNVVFGYPDLAVSIEGAKERKSGEELNYRVYFENVGHSAAKDVLLEVALPEDVEAIVASGSPQVSGRNFTWLLGEVGVGQSGSFDVRAVVGSDIEKDKNIETEASVVTSTEEKELNNNFDAISTRVSAFQNGNENENEDESSEDDFSPALKVRRSTDAKSVAKPGDFVKHSIIVENSGDTPVFEIELFDRIKNSAGEEIGVFVQSIGNMDVGKKVLVEYVIQMNDPGADTSITNVAEAVGKDPFSDRVKSKQASLIFSLLGGNVSYAKGVATETGDNLESNQGVASAEASWPSAEVLGTGSAPARKNWPLWAWLSALLSYLLAVNWIGRHRNI
jgi:hypothetical protein